MIISDKDNIYLKGSTHDLTKEWAHLYRGMIENYPEVVAETQIAFGNELLNANINPLIRTIVHELVRAIKGDLDHE